MTERAPKRPNTPNTTNTTVVTGWWGTDLPNRTCVGTYQLYPAHTMPDVRVNPVFKDINTIQDVEKLHKLINIDELINSCTSCYVTFSKPDLFYCDQQGCVRWYYAPDKGVYTNYGDIVAKSIPEFFSRVLLENNIWHKVHILPKIKNGTRHFTHNPETLTDFTEDELLYVEALLHNTVNP